MRKVPTPQNSIDSKELDDDVLRFVGWACGRWELLRNLFIAEDSNQYVVKGSIGRRGLTLSEWSQKVKALGFHDNARPVFDDILCECNGDSTETRPERFAGTRQNVRTTVFVESMSLSQFMRFQTRVVEYTASLAAAHENSPVNVFVKFLQQHRGSVLRAWRLDLDIRGTGRIAFVDFAHACRQLGVPNQARLVWNALRTQDDSRLLEFADLGGEEATNLDVFAETLWDRLGFDLDKAWHSMDVHNQQWLAAAEFEVGVKELGFQGNARQLFQGLDTDGLGRIQRIDFDYVRFATRVPPRKLQQCSGAIVDLIQWVQRRLGGIEGLVDKLAIATFGEMSVGDLAVRLTALGFEGDALQAAAQAARNAGAGTHVTTDSLRHLFTRTSQAGNQQDQCQKTKTCPQQKVASAVVTPPRQQWDGGVQDFAAMNLVRPNGVRKYFSVPESCDDADQGFAPKKPQCSRSTKKPCWNSESVGNRPRWNDEVFTATEVNNDLPASCRLYFSDAGDKPVREAMKPSQSARSLHNKSNQVAAEAEAL